MALAGLAGETFAGGLAGGTGLLRLGEPLAGNWGTGGGGRHYRVFKKLCENPLSNPVGYLVRE